MHLCDAPAAHPAFDKGVLLVADGLATVDAPHLGSFHTYVRTSTASYMLRDQHWRLFGDNREASAALDAVSGEIKPKIFEYPGAFSYLTDDGATPGDDFAKMRLEAENAESLVLVGQGTTFAVPTGASADVAWQGKTSKVLVIGATHRLTGQQPLGQDSPRPVLSVEFESINVEKPFRPVRLTPKPFARGPQVATVVGEDKKEVDPDAFGRVRVQFPWDHSGRTNEKCSCLIRVSSSWAGPGMGESFLPRVGHEVLVSYIDGDMDRPIITGRVYNAKNTVYKDGELHGMSLPGHEPVSGWVTQTILGKSTSDYDGAVSPPTEEPGYNALLFSDRSGQEKVYMRAQRDHSVDIKRDRTEWAHRDVDEKVGRNLTLEVQTGDEKHTVTKGKRTTSIKMNDELTVTDGDHVTKVQSGSQTITIDKGNQTTTVSLGNIKIDATAGKIEISAAQSIELKVGASSIKLDPGTITLKSALISSEATATNTVKGTAMVVVNGGLVKIN